MKVIFYFVLILSSAVISQSAGQSIDVRTAKFPGLKKLTVILYASCDSGTRTLYYFDNNGNFVKTASYFKHKRLFSCAYRYNEKGLLSEENETYSINHNNKDTVRYTYEFDTLGRMISVTEHRFNYTFTEYHQDFDSNNKPKTIRTVFDDNRIVIRRLQKYEYDLKGQIILEKHLENDSVFYLEEKKYNSSGDINYSNVPTLLDKETGKMIWLLGGNRFSVVEAYEYNYDNLNRWTEKYVVIDDRKVLVEKRLYE